MGIPLSSRPAKPNQKDCMGDCALKPIRLLACVAVATSILSSAAFAQRQAAVGPGIIPLSAAGSLNGVDMSASGITGTLSVGVVGGPQTDIFSSNSGLSSPLQAVSTA